LDKIFDRKSIKLAAFDIDGTIFNEGRMCEAVGSALTKLSEAGVEMVIATGRPPFSIPNTILDLGVFRYAVCDNGTLVWDFENESPISRRPFEREKADKVLELMDKLTDAYFVSFEKESCLTPRHLELLREHVKLEIPKDGSPPKEIYPTFENLPAHVSQFDEPVYKMGCRFDTPEACAEAAVIIREECGIEVCSTGGKDLELTPLGVHKGSGTAILCEHLGFDIENAIAFGDSGNDVDLLKIAGYAVVVGNGQQSALSVADYIAPPVQESGVAKAIEDLFGI